MDTTLIQCQFSIRFPLIFFRYGKLSYFLTLFPYVIITTLLAYTATFDGFMDGVNYYLTPDWTALQNPQVWENHV